MKKLLFVAVGVLTFCSGYGDPEGPAPRKVLELEQIVNGNRHTTQILEFSPHRNLENRRRPSPPIQAFELLIPYMEFFLTRNLENHDSLSLSPDEKFKEMMIMIAPTIAVFGKSTKKDCLEKISRGLFQSSTEEGMFSDQYFCGDADIWPNFDE
jgi:hypothetical protein